MLIQPGVFPDKMAELRKPFSLWVEEILLKRLNQVDKFTELQPVLLGSWSRHELCPRSDIDLLLVGDEDRTRKFIEAAFSQGLKLRARTPEDLQDWTVGVQPFDIMALDSARILNSVTQEALDREKKRLVRWRRRIFSAIRKEREARRKRQDSIASYLEPNLKYGTGGLRDIEQALGLHSLFKDTWKDVDPYPFKVLRQVKEGFLYLRSVLHLLGSGDILTAHDQLEITKLLQLDSNQTLMKFVQSELERASFYGDWVVSYLHKALQGKLKKNSKASKQKLGIKDLHTTLAALRRNPDILMQFEIRRQSETLFKSVTAKEKGQVLHKYLSSKVADDFLVALHRTRLLEQLIPDLKKIRGLVQHDHYHRFTADAHLVQTLREVQRAQVHTKGLGVVGKLTKGFTTQDWWTLKLTALFHDLAKGRKGDHSTEGAKLVQNYLSEWGYSESLRNDVAWLVENHLILSNAAFRQNPRAQSTWKRLFDRGVQGRRLKLLAMFTAIDIRATNPDAWTPWKAQLLYDLVQKMESPEALQLRKHLIFAQKNKIKDAEGWLLALDPMLLEMLPPKLLLEDLKACAESDEDCAPKAVMIKNRLWIRFHRRKDDTGVFLGFVQSLFGLGLSVRTASVHTLPDIGVYDWFSLRTEKTAKQIATWLQARRSPQMQIPKVEFQSIELMAQDQDEWIFSFRGKDQRGLLLNAAHSLVEQKLSLRWARVYTWGQQVEDIFSVQPLGEVETTLNRLRQHFVT